MVTSLLELRLERIKHLANLELDYLKRFFDRELILSKSYEEGWLEMHIHAYFAGSRVCGVLRVLGLSRSEDVERVAGDNEFNVFVEIAESAKMRRPIASLIRLQLFDCPYVRAIESGEIFWLPSRESIWSVFYRELRKSAFLDPGIQLGESSDKVVESRPEVVSGISSKNSEAVRDFDRFTPINIRDHSCLARFYANVRATLYDHSFGCFVADRNMKDIQLVEMFAAPIQPKISVTKRTHQVQSSHEQRRKADHQERSGDSLKKASSDSLAPHCTGTF